MKKIFSLTLVLVFLVVSVSIVRAKTCPKYGYCNIIKSECLTGQCVAYCKAKTGFSKNVGDAKNWPTNSSKPVKGGVVVLKIGSFGHVAYIESVDEKKKTFKVSQYNNGSLLCKECGVTDKYKKVTEDKYSFNDKKIKGFWKKS
ncbi:MAG: CHAP domain-containing protein [Desulfuromonadaceae bacterium]